MSEKRKRRVYTPEQRATIVKEGMNLKPGETLESFLTRKDIAGSQFYRWKAQVLSSGNRLRVKVKPAPSTTNRKPVTLPSPVPERVASPMVTAAPGEPGSVLDQISTMVRERDQYREALIQLRSGMKLFLAQLE